jgi:putative DNA methylase
VLSRNAMQRILPADSSTASLLSRIDWDSVSRIAAHELHNREIHAPAVSAFRWWARRPHSVMAALLDAAVARFGERLTVSDPFSGGGTVAFEAARRGLRTYAQDLYPWPTYGLSTALQPVKALELEKGIVELLSRVEHLRSLYTRPDGAELSHIIRVRNVYCDCCASKYYEFPTPLVSLRSRTADEREAYFGCRGCGAISMRGRDIKKFVCACGQPQSALRISSDCPHCAKDSPASTDVVSRPSWTPVLVQEIDNDGARIHTRLRPVKPDDPTGDSLRKVKHPALESDIADGVETRRLVSAGFKRWKDLYTARQSNTLLCALENVNDLAASKAVKDRIALCVLGAAEMPGYISRWDRFHLKAFEGTANHRFSSGSLVVESNILATIGRGSLHHRFRSARKASEWIHKDKVSARDIATTNVGARGRRPTNWDVLVATGSSKKQALNDRSVHIVLTDPPYHDDVQYGEISRLFHAWLSVYRHMRPIDEHEEAVANTNRQDSKNKFEDTIAGCLRESCRTLRKDGVLVLTFHNKQLFAWQALARALNKSGFVIRALAAVRAENGDDHCKRNVKAMLHDLVIECIKRGPKSIKTKLVFRPTSRPEKNLAAVGLALAAAVESGDSESLTAKYKLNLHRLRSTSPLMS